MMPSGENGSGFGLRKWASMRPASCLLSNADHRTHKTSDRWPEMQHADKEREREIEPGK